MVNTWRGGALDRLRAPRPKRSLDGLGATGAPTPVMQSTHLRSSGRAECHRLRDKRSNNENLSRERGTKAGFCVQKSRFSDGQMG
jgi:hypothetical protein